MFSKETLASRKHEMFNGVDISIDRFVELKDKFGNKLLFLNAGDVWLGPTPVIEDGRERLEQIKEMDLREDDIIIAGFPKSGNHWMQQIGRMLVQNSTEYKPNSLNFETLEYIPAHLITPPDKPRVFFTHLRFHHLPRQVLEKSVKIIHLIRNPKDTFASLYTFLGQHKEPMKYEGTWDQFFSVMLDMGFWHGDFFDHLLDWEREIAAHPELPIFVLAYEDLKQNTLGCVEKLNEFLELKRSPELCRDICEVCTLTTMKEKEEKLLRQLNITDNGFTYVYRKGEIGDWKNWFTEAQNEQFDKVYKKRMAKSERKFIFE